MQQMCMTRFREVTECRLSALVRGWGRARGGEVDGVASGLECRDPFALKWTGLCVSVPRSASDTTRWLGGIVSGNRARRRRGREIR